MKEPAELIADYVRNQSESAFGELVERYINLVYSVAVRRVGGDSHIARDVTQTVFIDLARKANSLPSTILLGGWLHRHTCFIASTVMRTERRRQAREREVLEMEKISGDNGNETMAGLSPILDKAIDSLGAADRNAIVMRFFEQKDFNAVGKELGTNGDAAQKRVSRALEKLRKLLSRQGVVLSGGVLVAELGKNAAAAAPAGMAAQVTTHALIAASAGSAGITLIGLMHSMKAWAVAIVAAGLVLGVSLIVPRTIRQHTRGKLLDTSGAAIPMAAISKTGEAPDLMAVSASVAPSNKPALRVAIVAADSDKPVPNVEIDFRCWEGSHFSGRKLQANRMGICDVDFSRDATTDLELTSRTDGFADTRLHWRLDRGEIVPETYALKLTRPVKIGGVVVDPDGHPVSNAKVGFNHRDDPASLTVPENHEFGWIEVATDSNGHWEINRIAPEMIRRIYGTVKHDDYVGTGFYESDEAIQKSLLAGTYKFQLGRTVVARGSVVDQDGFPVAGAKVLVGKVSMSDRREGLSETDGTFQIKGCAPGKSLMSAEAEGFAVSTVAVELTETSNPVQIRLQKGKVLRMRVVNTGGQPIARANVWLDTMHNRPLNAPDYNEYSVQTEFNRKTGADGTLVWSNAPASNLSFDIAAEGAMRLNQVSIQPDGEEHVITLPPALVLSGTVKNSETGEPVPRFQIITGWPQTNFIDGSVQPQFSNIERYWAKYSGGKFTQTLEEPALYGVPNPGYIFRFEAEGFVAQTSRPIRPDEGKVELDIRLRPASAIQVTVQGLDGAPLPGVDIGFVAKDAHLSLLPGRLSNKESGTHRRTSDLKGQFSLPADDAIRRVVLAHPSGYAVATLAELGAEGMVQLQPWGKVEGTYSSAGKPAANQNFTLRFADDERSAIDFDFVSWNVSTDAEGHFVFPKAPSGKFKLIRLIRVQANGFQEEPVSDIEIKPGETTTVSLGGNGYIVKALLRWPEHFDYQSAEHIMASVNTPVPDAFLHAETPEASTKLQSSAEFQEYQRTARHFAMSVAPNGTLEAENIPPGTYQIMVMAMMKGQDKHPLMKMATFTVPSEPEIGTIDAGELVLSEKW